MPRQYIEIEEEPHWVLKYITLLCRTFGIITGFVFWWATIEILSTTKPTPFIGWYNLAMVIVFTFIEAIWLMDKCRCCDDHGCCCTTWRVFLWLDAWRKTIVYVLIAIPMLMPEYSILYSIIPGCFLMILAAFYFMKTFKRCHCFARQRLRTRTAGEDPEVASSYTQPPPPAADVADTPTK